MSSQIIPSFCWALSSAVNIQSICQPVVVTATTTTTSQHLCSATQRKLVVPRYRLSSFSRRRFPVAGTSTWNSLSDSLRDPELSLDTFKRRLKTYCKILMTKCIQRIRDLFEYALYKFTLYFTYYCNCCSSTVVTITTT